MPFLGFLNPQNAVDKILEQRREKAEIDALNLQLASNTENAKQDLAQKSAQTDSLQSSADTQQIIKWIAIVVLLLIIAFAIWYYLKHRG